MKEIKEVDINTIHDLSYLNFFKHEDCLEIEDRSMSDRSKWFYVKL